MDDIGRAAGITGPGIYRHFASKEAILSTAVEVGATQILTRVHDIVDHAASPEAALKALIRNFIRATLNKPELASILLNDRQVFTPDTREFVDRAEADHLKQWLRQLRALRPDLSAAEARTMIHATAGLLAAVLRSPTGLERARLEQVLQGMAEASLFAQDRVRPPGRLAPPPAATPEPVDAHRRSRRPRRRDLILDSAADLFAERGFAGTGIDEIGAAAGITGPGVYRHFASKDEILKCLVQEAVERLLGTDSTRPLVADDDPEEVLTDLVIKLVNDTRDNAALARVAWNEQRSLGPETRAWLLRLHRLRSAEWVHLVSRIRPETPDLELLTLVNGIYGMVIEAAQHDQGLKEEHTREVLINMVLRVVLPPAPTRRRSIDR